LKIARVIRRAGQRRDFPLGQLGREPLHTNIRKTDGRHRAAQIHRATGGNGQRLESFFILHSAFCICFEQSQIIGRIPLKL
jgi:hypothetical protein